MRCTPIGVQRMSTETGKWLMIGLTALICLATIAQAVIAYLGGALGIGVFARFQSLRRQGTPLRPRRTLQGDGPAFASQTTRR